MDDLRVRIGEKARLAWVCGISIVCWLLLLSGLTANAYAVQGESLEIGASSGLTTQDWLSDYHVVFDDKYRDKASYPVNPGQRISPEIKVYDSQGNDVTSRFSIEVYKSADKFETGGNDVYDFGNTVSFPVDYGHYLVAASSASDYRDIVLGEMTVREKINGAVIDFGSAYAYTGSGIYPYESDLAWAIPSGAVSGPTVYTSRTLDPSDYTCRYYSRITHEYVGSTMPVAAGTYYCIVMAADGSYYDGSNYSHDFVITQDISSAAVYGIDDATYSGQPYTPTPTVVLQGATLVEGQDYTVSYQDNVSAGIASVAITGKGYYQSRKDCTFTIHKASNTLKAKASKKTVKIKAASVSNSKKVIRKNVKVSKAIGKVTYKNASKNKSVKKFKVNKKTGKVTVPAGTQPGTYKMKIKVTAKGDRNHASKSKTVSYKIKVA